MPCRLDSSRQQHDLGARINRTIAVATRKVPFHSLKHMVQRICIRAKFVALVFQAQVLTGFLKKIGQFLDFEQGDAVSRNKILIQQ